MSIIISIITTVCFMQHGDFNQCKKDLEKCYLENQNRAVSLEQIIAECAIEKGYCDGLQLSRD